MSMSKAMRQMPARAGRAGAARGEAACEPVSDEADGPRHEPNDTLVTSTSRTARCGPACWVVWEGSGLTVLVLSSALRLPGRMATFQRTSGLASSRLSTPGSVRNSVCEAIF